jgi:eukaryotic-like serine/threonine-protein kinase
MVGMDDLESDATLPQVADTPTAPTGTHAPAPPADTGYELREQLGKGGMGEVVLARDPRIGRDVALKRMRGVTDSSTTARFLREAEIQARLEHPAIVPVYEIGRDDDDLPYFTMKRLTGTTLSALLERGDATQQRLLRALAEVCLAVEFAHSRGIVHRDLKPSNIMLGDFGEVYVIDWGVARILDEREVPSRPSVDVPAADATRDGQILGTPGYMAPEQISATAVTAAADVYAIGSILFEVLAGESLHPRGAAALASTVGMDVQISPAARAPRRSIAPELDAVCVAALARDPETRPTARQLGDQIQQYLDGDRDIERRRLHASKLVARGRQALAANDAAGAVRFGGRALAFDPSSTEAAQLVMTLLLQPAPSEAPPAVQAKLAEHEELARRERSRRALLPYGMFLALAPLSMMLHVESWPQLLGLFAVMALMLFTSLLNWRTGRMPSGLTLVIHLIAVIALSRLGGPFVVTPVVIIGMMMSVSSLPWMNDRPWLVIAYTTLLVLAPSALEALHVLPATSHAAGNGVLVDGTVFDSPGDVAIRSMVFGNLAVVIAVTLYARSITRDRRKAQRDQQVQTYLLEQLLPQPAARPSISG